MRSVRGKKCGGGYYSHVSGCLQVELLVLRSVIIVVTPGAESRAHRVVAVLALSVMVDLGVALSPPSADVTLKLRLLILVVLLIVILILLLLGGGLGRSLLLQGSFLILHWSHVLFIILFDISHSCLDLV